MSDLAIVTTSKSYGRDDRWIGSRHGLDTAIPGTAKIAAFVTAGYVKTDAGFRATLVGGTPVALDTDDTYIPFTAEVDQVLEGYIHSDVSYLRADGTSAPKVPIAVVKHMTIVRSHLPFGSDKVGYDVASTGSFAYAD